MSDTRVDKQWQSKGLASYPTGAILGTLAHYGIGIDEAAFTQDASKRFPSLTIEPNPSLARSTRGRPVLRR